MDEDDATDVVRVVAPDHWLHDEYTRKLQREATEFFVNREAVLQSACVQSQDPYVRECYANLRNAEIMLRMLRGLEP